MAIRGALNHLDLTVADLERSVAFYDRFLTHLGFERLAGSPDPVWQMRFGSGTSFCIALQRARPGSRDNPHDRYAPGLHHVAFHAESREDVDRTYQFVNRLGVRILDPPAEYAGPAYSEGYYAVFFTDPDGLKLEVVHEPRTNP